MPNTTTRVDADHCPACGREIGDWDMTGVEADDGRWCMAHAVAAEATIDGDTLRCVNSGPDCAGAYEYRMPLSGTGKSFLRCDHHWSERLDVEERTRERYGHPDSVMPPSDFDPTYAGESWDGDY